MCLERRFPQSLAALVKLFMLLRPHAWKMVCYQWVDGERRTVPPFKGVVVKHTANTAILMPYSEENWNYECDFREDRDKTERIVYELRDDKGRGYKVGFHCYVTKRGAGVFAADAQLEKIKFRDIRAVGWQQGLCLVVGAMKFISD